MNGRELTLDQLVNVVDADASVDDLKTYFGTTYTGSRFEFLAGGGDRLGVADRFTAEDLVAVRLLSVNVPGQVALDLLEGQLGKDVAALLHKVPNNVRLGGDDAEVHVQDGSSADQAWQLLDHQPGVGFAIAGKLLARKRPHLIPVYDAVVKCALGKPPKVWVWLHRLLRADGRILSRRLVEVRTAARMPPEVSDLRILDVILWMRHHKAHRLHRNKCSGLEF